MLIKLKIVNTSTHTRVTQSELKEARLLCVAERTNSALAQKLRVLKHGTRPASLLLYGTAKNTQALSACTIVVCWRSAKVV